MNSSNQLFFTSSKMELISIIHDYLNDQPEIGKVMSFATLLKIGKELNNKKELDIIQLALLYSELPDKYKNYSFSIFVYRK